MRRRKPSQILWDYVTAEKRVSRAVEELEQARFALVMAEAAALALVREHGAVEGYGQVFGLADDALVVQPVVSIYTLDGRVEAAPLPSPVGDSDFALIGAAEAFGLPDDAA